MNHKTLQEINNELKATDAVLIAVSKTKPAEAILSLYAHGQRRFGENKVQELVEKYEALPKDIEWHLIGHLQTNKVKYIASFVHMIHAVDSFKLLEEINKQALKHQRIIDVLLQIHIAEEETKFGLSQAEALALLEDNKLAALQNIRICGLMGMATNTTDEEKISREFQGLKVFFDTIHNSFFNNQPHFRELSMGMSSDYKLALQHGSTMIRVGSALFGVR